MGPPSSIEQLAGYVRSRQDTLQQRYVGILTDGAEWRLYHLTEGTLEEVSVHEVFPTKIGALERVITSVLDQAAPANLLSICGVGPLVAAKILGEVRDVARFSSAAAFASYSGTAPVPASSGTIIRRRLHRGGNRQLNRALHTVALTQARRDDRAKQFLARKRAEGKTPREARRALKRHLAEWLKSVTAILASHAIAASSSLGSSPPSSSSILAIDPIEK